MDGAAELEVKHYKLTKRYWNGKVMVKAGSVERFLEGKQPKGSILVDEPELEVASDEVKEPAEITVGSDEKVAEVGTSSTTAKVKK